MHPSAFLHQLTSDTLRSPQTGVEYSVSVACGATATTSDPQALLIVLDAPYILGTIVETVRLQEMGGEVVAPIVVGVGTTGDIHAHMVRRLKDFTPPQYNIRRAENGPVGSMLEGLAIRSRRSIGDLLGGAEAFLDFICTDLLRLVSSRYAVNERDLGLFGHSAGAVFCRYALLSRPGYFRRFLMGSLGTGWYGEDLGDLEDAFFTQLSPQDRVSVFQAVGEAELYHRAFGPNLRGGLEAMEKLAMGAPELIDLTQVVIAKETHCSVMAPLAAAGVRTLYGTGLSFMDAL